jgi:predicted O-methyltransferase YrrM
MGHSAQRAVATVETMGAAAVPQVRRSSKETPPGSAVGMDFSEFREQFGSSFRTNNLLPFPDSRLGRMVFATRLLFRPGRGDRRLYPMPATSEGRRGLIRLDPWEGEYLFVLASLATLGILEIGRYYGGSTFLLACANRAVPIWSIDLVPRRDKRGQAISGSEVWDRRLEALLHEHGVGENVRLLVGDSQRDCFPQVDPYDVLFVDGEHSYEGVTTDLEQHYPRLAPGGHVVLHDCSGEVAQATSEFAAGHEAIIVRMPRPGESWRNWHGSIGHFRKPV